MGKFLVALIKASFFAWVGLFTVVILGVSALFYHLKDSGIYTVASYDPAGDVHFALTMAFFTALIFFYVFAREYGFTLGGWLHGLKMKWMLRGVGRD